MLGHPIQPIQVGVGPVWAALATLSILFKSAWLMCSVPWPPYPSYIDRLGSCIECIGHPSHPIDLGVVNPFRSIQLCFAKPPTIFRSAWLMYRLPSPPHPSYVDRRGSCIDCLGHPIHLIDLCFATLSILYKCAWPPHPSYTRRLGFCIDSIGHNIGPIQIGLAPV